MLRAICDETDSRSPLGFLEEGCVYLNENVLHRLGPLNTQFSRVLCLSGCMNGYVG